MMDAFCDFQPRAYFPGLIEICKGDEDKLLCSTTIIYSGQRQLKFPVSVNYFSRPATIRPSFLPSEVHLCF